MPILETESNMAATVEQADMSSGQSGAHGDLGVVECQCSHSSMHERHEDVRIKGAPSLPPSKHAVGTIDLVKKLLNFYG